MRSIIRLLAVLSIVSISTAAGAYQIRNDMLSPTGGALGLGDVVIPSCNMQPYGHPTAQDLDVLFTEAKVLQEEGEAFKGTLGFYNCPSDPACGLLTDPSANYETLGFVEAFQQNGTEGKLRSAIRYFAYLVKKDYSPDASYYLRKALRDLVSIYMVFADEFLIDALDYRFSATTPNVDTYLDEQIEQLGKAVQYYETGSLIFTSIWLEPVDWWSGEVIGQYFEQDDWDLFNLLYQRLSMALREKGSRERVRMSKTTTDLKGELSEAAMGLFIQATTMAQTLGDQFPEYGGQYILTALNLIRKQVDDLNNNLNPLGYDERYVPLNDYDSLHGLAENACTASAALESKVQQETRDYDYILEKVQDQQNSLNTTYVSQLAELTGCSAALASDAFKACVESSGGDLDDCPMDLDPDAFDSCVKSKVAGGGTLGAKYRQMKDADLSLERAQLQYENVGKRIEYENARVNYMIQVWKDYTGAQKEALDEYQNKMKNACTITKTTTKTKGKKGKEKSVVKSFTLRDDKLDLDIHKEKEVLDATLNFQIKQAQDGKAISDLLLEQADALIGIDMAVQNMNGMIAAFDFSMRQKENLLALWRRNEEFIEKYWTQKLPTHRIIQSEANIQLSRKLNEVAHYSFLASKALEYKFMQVLQGISLGALGLLNIADIFKCQTTSDFKDYLDKLQAYNVVECPGGTFQSHTYRVSLALNILGLTDENLGDIDGDGYIDATGIPVEDERFQKFQQFVNEHRDQNGNLVFTFTTSVYDQLLVQYQKANLKIWQGPIPCATSLNTKGMTAGLFFRGTSGSIFPVIHVAQKGVQPFLRKNHDLAGYYPVKTRALMNINDTAPEPFTQDYFTPFNGIDPRFQTGSMGEWTPAFTNRGVAATQWQVTLYVAPAEEGFDKVPLEKLKDLCFYLDTIGNNFEE